VGGEATCISASAMQPPTPCFTMNPPDPEVGEIVTLDASCTTDYDWRDLSNGVVTYQWQIGTNRAPMSGKVVTTIFGTEGYVPIRMRALDSDGYWNALKKTVYVYGLP
jgi:hypothetical protein